MFLNVYYAGKSKSVADSFTFGAFYNKINLGGIYNNADSYEEKITDERN